MQKKYFYSLLWLIFSVNYYAQSWIWMHGNNTTNASPAYGTQGVSSATSNPGGLQGGASCWRDANGNFWMFGGYGSTPLTTGFYLNDVWKFDPVINQWTWVRGTGSSTVQLSAANTPGVPSTTNTPGGRVGAACWTDNNHNMWLFGGTGSGFSNLSANYLSDLWMYNSTSNEWTFVRGVTTNQPGHYGMQGIASTTNSPGGRVNSSFWTDNTGNLWLFGGRGFDGAGVFGYLNDLWKYTISTNEWTWMAGSATVSANGIYGVQGTPGAANMPGARESAAVWENSSNQFYLFGGTGFPSTGTVNPLNDLWRYDIATNQWTWINGSNLSNQNGTYGIQGTSSVSNRPGARFGCITWTDPVGDQWLFGGYGSAVSSGGYLNDLWKYNKTTNAWAWIAGSNSPNSNGNYGTVQTSSPSNMIGARYSSPGWSDLYGGLWVFGGQGYPGSATVGNLNDIWKYPNCITPSNPTNISVSSQTLCAGTSASLGAVATGSVYWYNSPTTTVNAGIGNTFTFVPSSTGQYTYYAEARTCTASAQRTPVIFTITISSPTIQVQGGIICAGGSFTLNPSGAVSYSYSGGSNVVSPISNTVYLISGSDIFGCVSVAQATVNVSALPVISVNSGTICMGSSFTMSPSGAASYSYSSGGPVVSPALTGSYTVYGTNANGCTSQTPAISTVSVYALPEIGLSADRNNICAGERVSLAASGAAHYTWSFGITGNTLSTTPSVTTLYEVSGTDGNGCTNTATLLVTVDRCTGIEAPDEDRLPFISLFPNPFVSGFNVLCKLPLTGTLRDIAGREIVTMHLGAGLNTITLPELPKGLYFLTGQGSIGLLTIKIIKE